jgi:hypothetical protein
MAAGQIGSIRATAAPRTNRTGVDPIWPAAIARYPLQYRRAIDVSDLATDGRIQGAGIELFHAFEDASPDESV